MYQMKLSLQGFLQHFKIMIILWGSSRCIGRKDDRLQLSWRKFKFCQPLHSICTNIGCTPGLDSLFAALAIWHRYCFPPNAVEVRVNYQWEFQLPKLATSDFAKQDNELSLLDIIAYGFFKASK